MDKARKKPRWITVHKRMTKEGVKLSFRNSREYTLVKDQYTATPYDDFKAVALATRDRIVERWITTQQRYHDENLKRVYYLSMEFLIGRLLENNVINLGLENETKEALEDMGLDIKVIFDQEKDAGLGNGGLGRLAACFLDSMTTLGIPAHGYGIRYDYGIFNQKIINGFQVECPDEWLKAGNPWEFAVPERSVRIKFHGQTQMFFDEKNKLRVHWKNTRDVLAVPYDIPIPGYQNDSVNTLRLWSARSIEGFDLSRFNNGDYEQAVQNKIFSESISKILYPNDNVTQGRELRLKQQYFFVAASIADIIRRFQSDNSDLRKLPDKAAIQLNDTHPALAVAELMRILIDEKSFEWETAWDITVRTFAYTNHSVMPESVEKWPVPLFEVILPRHLQIIYEINHRFLKEVRKNYRYNAERMKRMSIIEEGDPKHVRMGHLSIVGSHSVNGVSKLHTDILKTRLFRDFYEIYPERFNSKTNGITQRRWLRKANPGLSGLITEAIGEGWITDLSEVEKILPFKEDPLFREKWSNVKRHNKGLLADYIHDSTGIVIDPQSMFDVQVKRMHEYKRQLLFCLFIISQYLKIKNSRNGNDVPRTFMFGGKAASGYEMAKLIIKFISNVAEIINKDADVNEKLKLVFLENYRVSLAEKIFPASELSEQISTAGHEASGTGCMKFMTNGALTIGTLDGANIEIKEAVGDENIFIFGLNAAEIEGLKSKRYRPRDYISRSPILQEILRLMQSNFFSPAEPGIFTPVINSLMNYDPFFVCADFDAYRRKQEVVSSVYRDGEEWTKKSIINVACSGEFSSDRTVQEYAGDIWHVPCGKAVPVG